MGGVGDPLTETAVAVVHHEVGPQGPGGEVVHAAGAVRHVAHHDGVRLRESGWQTDTHTGSRISPVASFTHTHRVLNKPSRISRTHT